MVAVIHHVAVASRSRDGAYIASATTIVSEIQSTAHV